MKTIQLTKGKVAQVDDEDFDRIVNMGKWLAIKGNGSFYAAKNRPRWQKRLGLPAFIMMHNVIMRPPVGLTVDHKDRDGLNNQKYNLRNATGSQQMINQELRMDNSSGYRGVSWDKSREKWSAEIHYERKKVFIGRFDVIEDAVEAYKNKVVELYGEFVP